MTTDASAAAGVKEGRPEILLLLRCLRREPAPETARLLARPIDWTYLVQTSLDHGVTQLIFRHLVAIGTQSIPTEIQNAALAYSRKRAEQNQRYVVELLTVIRALEKEGIPVVPFKGPVIAEWFYGDVSLRSFRDLD